MTNASDGYPPPGEPFLPPPPYQPTPDYLGAAVPPKRSKRKPVLLALGTAVLVLVGGAAFAAFSVLSGGGAQPEDALPGNVVGYAEIDLDPGAGQKLNAFRLARKFPDAKVTGESSLKDDLLRSLFVDDEQVDYDRDVRPWVGDRAGIAFLDRLDENDDPVVVAAVQYTDRTKAEAGLERLVEGDDQVSYAFGADGYVLVSDAPEVAQRAVADAKQGTLTHNARYRKALDELGGDRIAVAWADLEGIFDLIPKDLRADAGPFKDLDPKGSYIIGAQVKPDALEVNGTGVDIDLGRYDRSSLVGGRGTLVADLPANSLAAVSVVGLGQSLTASYDAFVEASKDEPDVTDFLDTAGKIGLKLPGDISALLGDETAAVLLPGSTDQPDIGGRTRGGDPARGLQVIRSIVAYVSDEDPAAVSLDGIVEDYRDGLLVATAPEVLDQLAKDGTLGETASFRNAVPHADASNVLYVNLAALFDAYGDSDFGLSPAELRNVAPLDAVGVSAEGDRFTMRITFR